MRAEGALGLLWFEEISTSEHRLGSGRCCRRLNNVVSVVVVVVENTSRNKVITLHKPIPIFLKLFYPIYHAPCPILYVLTQ